MRIYLVTCSFPPYSDSQTIRFLQWMSPLTSLPIEWHLIVPGREEDSTGMATGYLPANVTIHRTGIPVIFRWRARLGKQRLLSWLFTNLTYYLSYPDPFRGFDDTAADLMRRLAQQHPPDLIISSSGSPTAHLAALKLKEKMKVKWVADFGDPWSIIEKEFKPWFYNESKRQEQRIVEAADALLFTTDETRAAYEQLYPVTKYHVVPYGYLGRDFETRPRKHNGKIEIAHIGAAFAGDRNLIPSIQALGKLRDKYSLSIIGNHSSKFDDEARRLGLEARLLQRIDFAESLSEINATDVLLLVGNMGGLQVPGKVFHYLASGKIIIYVYQRALESDPAYKILGRFPGINYTPNDAGEIHNTLKFVESNFDAQKAEAETRKSSKQLHEYESAALGSQLVSIIENIGLPIR